jgi:4'-phosphopantetheinyl transferase
VSDFDLHLKLSSPGLVHVWVILLPEVRAQLDSLRNLLSPEENRRAARFAFERDQQRFVLSRGTLRVLLAQYLNREPDRIHFRYGAYGKPALTEEESRAPDLRFNVSHSGDYCLCAVALGREVGVDVEIVRPDIECLPLAERFFTKREYEDLQREPVDGRHPRFFRYWTCKEAYLKALGLGIASGLERVEVSFKEDGSVECGMMEGGPAPRPDYVIRPVSIAGNVEAAVAAEGDDWELAVSNYPAK